MNIWKKYCQDCCKFPELGNQKDLEAIQNAVLKDVDPKKEPELFDCVSFLNPYKSSI